MAEDTIKQQFQIPFNGKWDPIQDPLLIKKGDYSDITNFRYKAEMGLKGVSGYSKINTTPLIYTV